MEMKWVYPENQKITQEFVNVCGSKIIAQILANRGYDSIEKAKSFLNLDNYKLSDPYVFEDMGKSVARIKQAIISNEKIFIYGDFDCDGVTSTSVLLKTLRHLGANVDYYIPNRSSENHGLSSKAVLNLISKKQAKLIITVDCGVGNIAEVKLAKSFKCDVIITDHHEAAEELPDAYSIIDPKVMDGDLDIKNLAGVGVAYKLATALLREYKKEEYLKEILYLVSIGTIADVVPLVGENRALVHQGLKTIKEIKPIGLMKLLEINNSDISNIKSDTISFGIAPRINAIGRLESASEAVELLTTEDESIASSKANKLDYCNKKRQEICEEAFLEAERKISQEIDLEEDKAILLMQDDWHPGIIGIVASKLVEKYHKPAILFCLDKENNTARSSARSLKGVNLYETLAYFEDYFVQYGGHAFAAGCSLDLSKISFNDFKIAYNNYLKEIETIDTSEPVLKVDMSIKSNELSVELVHEIERLSPFGEKNPSPLFSVNNIILNQYKTIGVNANHLKLFLMDDDCNKFDALWWQRDSIDANKSDRINVAFTPSINSFNNMEKVQFIVKDVKLANGEKNKDIPSVSNLENIQDDSLKWIDLRKKTHIEDFLNKFIQQNNMSSKVFVENPKTIENIDKYPLLKQVSFDRNTISESKNIFLLDIPSDFSVLSKIIKNTKPNNLYIMDKNNHLIQPLDTIKRLAGMLKYVHNNKNGKVEINILASKLSVSNKLALSALKTLTDAKVIELKEESKTDITIDFKKAVNFNELEALNSFKEFKNSITDEMNFKDFISTSLIEEIKNHKEVSI